VYGEDVPALGPSTFLCIASALPAAKRLIVDFAKGGGVGRIVLVRSVAQLLCIGVQIADWPVSIRGFGLAVDLLSVKRLEDYARTSEMLKATVVGDFF
jgi:hypothetical protein